MTPGDEQEVVRFRTAQAVLLEREAAAARLNIPRALKPLEPDLQKASARIRAYGLDDPFREDRLRDLPPGIVRAAVDEARKAGLMTNGPEWTVRRAQMPELVEGMHKSFQRQQDLDRDVPGLSRGM
jgi:hypothetical protein